MHCSVHNEDVGLMAGLGDEGVEGSAGAERLRAGAGLESKGEGEALSFNAASEHGDKDGDGVKWGRANGEAADDGVPGEWVWGVLGV